MHADIQVQHHESIFRWHFPIFYYPRSRLEEAFRQKDNRVRAVEGLQLLAALEYSCDIGGIWLLLGAMDLLRKTGNAVRLLFSQMKFDSCNQASHSKRPV